MCYNDFGDNMSMQKKIKNVNNNVEVENTNDELKKLVVLILVVTGFFFIFYGITVLILNKDKKEDVEVTQIDFEKILVSQILEQPENNYYVIATIENDANNSTYKSLIEEYYKKEDHKKIYSINLNDPLNKSFIGDKTNLQGEVKNFKFEKSTLLEIEEKTIKNISEGSTDILEKLNNLE